MGKTPLISVTILTKNAEETLAKALDSVSALKDVVILDNGSTDETLAIAKRYSNVSIFHSPFIGFGPLHNLANTYAKNDWILALDSDEFISQELLEELLSLPLDPKCIYQIDRKNLFQGKWIRGCGWYPDSKVRLFHRKSTQFTNDLVHESVMKKNLQVNHLKNPLYHTPYLSIDDFLNKMQLYSSLYVKNDQRKKSSLLKALIAGIFTFIKSYLLKGGFRDGQEGLIISLYNSHTTYYKYLKLAMYQKKNKLK